MRKLIISAGLVLLIFGLACLNYTRADGWEHHQAFAREHHIPEPDNNILLGGVISVILGAALIGYSLGSRARRNVDTSATSPTAARHN